MNSTIMKLQLNDFEISTHQIKVSCNIALYNPAEKLCKKEISKTHEHY